MGNEASQEEVQGGEDSWQQKINKSRAALLAAQAQGGVDDETFDKLMKDSQDAIAEAKRAVQRYKRVQTSSSSSSSATQNVGQLSYFGDKP